MSGEQAQPPPASAAKLERHQLFISYSHWDGEWVERLRRMIKPLEQRYGLERWDDSRIQAGMPWRNEIQTALARAQVALLMVSADFLASDFVTREELPPLFHAAKEEGLRILWVPLRPCLWKLIPEIEQYQAVIPPGRTLAEMAEVEQERAFVQIAERILSTFQKEAERQARERKEEEERLIREKETLEREAERERLERQQEEVQRLAREREQRQAREDAERWKGEEERLAREKEELERREADRMAGERKAEKERQDQERLVLEEQQRQREEESDVNARKTPDEPRPSIPCPWPESSAPPLPEGTERSGFGPLEMATIRREGSTWEIQLQAIETWGFRERLAEGVDLKMVAIPAGSFQMGSPEGEEGRIGQEGPQHKVNLKGFFLGQTPITQAQWKVVAGWDKVELDLNPDPSNFKGLQRPVERVNWHEAMEFCRRLSRRTGRRYGLPSEAQWEYACRAGTTTPFHFGHTVTVELANYDARFSYGSGPEGTYRQQTIDVGRFPANGWGLQDIHGNVLEWCEDYWHENYQGAPVDGRPWSEPQADAWLRKDWRRLRGGSWSYGPRDCRSACRYCDHPDYRYIDVGFRVCCLPPGHS